jgi:hypothetical protein
MLKFVVASLAVLVVAAPAMAQNRFQDNHPRRAEVNTRLRVQTHAINDAKRDGEITQEEARDLHKQSIETKKEERTEVKANGGYLTKEQTVDLNKDLNQTRKDLRAAKKD